MKTNYLSDLTPQQWDCIKDLIPPAKTGGRPRSLDMRAVVNGILYVVVGGIQWRMLPKEYPTWKSVYHYFRQWSRSGIWKRIHDTIRALLRRQGGRHKHPTAGSIDSQTVKAGSHNDVRGYDAGKKIKGRKRHIAVDTLGLLLVVVVTSAAIQDRDGARLVLKRMGGVGKKLIRLWGDSAYQGPLIAWTQGVFGIILTLVKKLAGQQGFVVLPRRWVVERTLGWFTLHRRLVKDYEVKCIHSESMVYLAMLRLMLRRLASS
jgi:putative transposase